MTLLDPGTTNPDFERDQWGRALIRVGDRVVPYIRASSAAKTVEDTYNLELWARRNVVFGMARDPSLVARVLAIGGDPSTWDLPTRKQVNRIHEDAAAVALAHKRADIGTALHTLTERTDRGESVIAGPYERDIEAYVNTLIDAGYLVDPGYIECRLVCDDLQMAGTADRFVMNTVTGRHLVADIKTGESVDYGGLGWAAQLAVYAHSDLYDVETGDRTPLASLDRTTGLIIHLPAGEGECRLYEIDLVAGHRAAVLANEIRAVRRESKRWITPIGAATAGVAIGVATPAPADIARHPSASVRRETLRARYRALPELTQAAFRARSVDPADLDAVELALDALEEGAAAPPAVAAPTTGALVERLGHGHDEGAVMPDAAFRALRVRVEALPDDARWWASAVIEEASRAGVPFIVRGVRSERRYWLYLGLIELAEHGVTDGDVVRRIVASVTDSDAPLFPSVTVGHAVGAMDAAQALAFSGACAAHVDNRV